MVGLEEAKDARPKATPPLGGPQHGDAGVAGGGKGSHKVAAKREGSAVGGGGGGKLVKWEDQPGDRPNGTAKPKTGRPAKDQPKVWQRRQAVRLLQGTQHNSHVDDVASPAEVIPFTCSSGPKLGAPAAGR